MEGSIERFEKELQDAEKRKAFEEAYARIRESGEAATPDEAAVKAAREALGIGLDLAALEKSQAAEEELDPEELDRIAGGEHAQRCWKDYACHYIYEHPDNPEKTDACFNNYVCFHIYKCTKAQN